MIKNIFWLFILSISNLISQNISPPLEKSDFTKLTSHEELKQFIQKVDEKSELIKSEVLTKSIEGRELFAVYFSLKLSRLSHMEMISPEILINDLSAIQLY